MNRKTLMLAGALAIALPPATVLADEGEHRMSEIQHKKQHMGGLRHHKDGEQHMQRDEAARPMSDIQHKKQHMGGPHHPSGRDQ